MLSQNPQVRRKKMKTRLLTVLGIIVLVASSAFAQENSKVEASVDFSYFHFVPQNNHIVQPFNVWGGGGSLVYYLGRLGIKADLQGYASTTQTFSFPSGSAFCPTGCSGKAQGNMFTYAFGPQFKIFRGHRIEPFVEALGGGAHTNLYGSALRNCTGCTTIARSPSNNAALFMIGGGIDFKLSPHITVRPGEVDYVLTRFGSAFTQGNNNQSNVRYLAGAVFRF
jgi:hypothetical protein